MKEFCSFSLQYSVFRNRIRCFLFLSFSGVPAVWVFNRICITHSPQHLYRKNYVLLFTISIFFLHCKFSLNVSAIKKSGSFKVNHDALRVIENYHIRPPLTKINSRDALVNMGSRSKGSNALY